MERIALKRLIDWKDDEVGLPGAMVNVVPAQ